MFNYVLYKFSYPEKTMDIVKKLSEDIAAEYREKQKKKLQRTFVGASEAASSKVKGIKRNCELWLAYFIFYTFFILLFYIFLFFLYFNIIILYFIC